jgi:hypothetical protein
MTEISTDTELEIAVRALEAAMEEKRHQDDVVSTLKEALMQIMSEKGLETATSSKGGKAKYVKAGVSTTFSKTTMKLKLLEKGVGVDVITACENKATSRTERKAYVSWTPAKG